MTLTTSHPPFLVCLVVGVTAEPDRQPQQPKGTTVMTSVTDTATPIDLPRYDDPNATGDEIVLLARVGGERMALTAQQVLDTIASYLATGGHMPTPVEGEPCDPYEPLHVITEQWLWGNVPGWLIMTSPVQLAIYRREAMAWIRSYFGPNFPHLPS